jgi:geranylgeranyl diphosphate synthase type II
MTYALLGPGKRIRPLLALLACEACGGAHEAALPAAVALEMVHTYSLVHDDLPAMDNDDLRRGRPTCHKQFDEATAILVGDGLLTTAFETLATSYPAKTAAVATLELAHAAGPAGMVGGQMLDLDAETGRFSVDSSATLEAIHRLKTGKLILAATRLGQVVAQGEQPHGVNPNQRDALDRYARNLGLAFQIMDDVLDVEGTTESLGKTAGKDAAAGKRTYPGFMGLEASRHKAEELIRDAEAALVPFGPFGLRFVELGWFVVRRAR